MRHFLSQGAIVVYEDARRKARWLIAPARGPGASVQMGSLTDFNVQLQQAATVYICDVGGRGSPEPTVCAALTVVLSTPDASHYYEWLKLTDKPTVHMPSWSSDEVTAVVPTVYPQRTLADGVSSIYPGRFKLYGGIASTIFSPDDDEHLEQKLTHAVQWCRLTDLLHSISVGTRLGPFQQLVEFVIGSNADGTPDFRTASIDFASDDICQRVMEEKEKRDANQIVSFLMSSAGKPYAAGMRGKVFEHWAHRVLAAGGDFRLRWENDAAHTDHTVHFPRSEQKGITESLTTLAAGVR